MLHVDYSHGYAGEGDTRTLIVCPKAFARPGVVAELAELYGAKHIIEVSPELALAGATNFSNLDPDTVLYYDDPDFAPIVAQLREIGLKVVTMHYRESAKKDGRLHCSIGQISRD